MRRKKLNLRMLLASIEIEEEGLSLEHESLMRKYMCGECDKDFENGLSLKFHMKSVHEARDTKLMKLKMKLFEIGGKISEQKLDLTNKICKLKENEFHGNETCQCIGWCAISHRKHSWKKSICQELVIQI